MYSSESTDLTVKNILKKIRDYDIFSYYIDDLTIGKAISSPLRVDNHPSFSVYPSDFGLKYIDYATGDQGTCFDFVMKKYNLNFFECLAVINNDFRLGLSSKGYTKPTLSIVGVKQDKAPARKNDTAVIQVKRRGWNDREDKSFWSQYGITCKILNFFNVYPLTHIWVNDWLVHTTTKDNPSYGYYFGDDHWKVYSPYSNHKFISNTPKDVYAGYQQLPERGDLLVMTKSLKDVICLYQHGVHAIAPQSEGQNITHKFMGEMKERFKRIVVFYDNDQAGKRGTRKVCGTHALNSVVTPEEKDISDYHKKFGREKTGLLIKNLLKL